MNLLLYYLADEFQFSEQLLQALRLPAIILPAIVAVATLIMLLKPRNKRGGK